MKKPELSVNEHERLKTLCSLNILDTAPEERFDRLTRMARKMFNVPIALVSLVDENRQWFKSCTGLKVRETSRDISFCGHAILGDEIFVIPDAKEDERFSDNPLVVNDPLIRFYAGCPLRALNGQKLGTLCIIDQKPRTFDSEDMAIFRDLATMAEQELAAVQLATLDDLTNITNRRGFLLLADHSLQFCRRENIPACLIFLDMDKFKLINDTFGHAKGDEALKIFSSHLERFCRNSDIFARIGGDEFVVLLSNTSKKAAEALVSRLNQSVECHNDEANCGYKINFSHGIVEFDLLQHRTVEDLLAEGDSVMYESKNTKKEVCFIDNA